ncbi:MAG: hypothetical protein JNL11_07940 [Bdellovibrionaceae bacterium]|nr:hypothetical protein [Pseudobdellovibrionaceae bacterium]
MNLIIIVLLLSLYSFANAPKGSKINNIELSKGSYIVLQLTDAQKEIRQFIITCEMTIPEEKLEPLVTSGVTHVALNSGGFQSLINHWIKPETDNYILCTNKETVKRTKLPKQKKMGT